MQGKSRVLVRSKQELANELLRGFVKKPKQVEPEIDLFRSEQPRKIQQFASPNNNIYSHSTILSEFTRYPIREDQGDTQASEFLNRFMYNRNKESLAKKRTASAYVQTEVGNLPSNTKQMTTKQGILWTKQAPKQAQTPPKIAEFNPNYRDKSEKSEKSEKSIIDVSANLSTMKYISANKNQFIENRVFDQSLIGKDQNLDGQSNDSAKDLLMQLEDIKDQSLDIQKPNKDKQPELENKEPIIKKVQLYRNKSKEEQIKENTNKNGNIFKSFEQQENDQKLQKILSKQSELKNLIIKKNKSQSTTTKQIPEKQPISQKSTESEITSAGKWAKTITKPILPNAELNKNQGNAMGYSQEEIDPTDLLPAYQTSSSGLQAVIEEENQSEMDESVKYRTKVEDFETPQDIIKKIFKMQTSQLKKQGSSEKSPTLEASKQPQKQQNPPIHSSSQQLQQLSLGDLEDVSSIQKTSGDKNLPQTYKKISKPKQLDENDLPDYEDSNIQSYEVEKQQMKKYIVNDISKDINNLKAKITQDASLKWEDLESDRFVRGENRGVENGSQGIDAKHASMLDFFDEVHNGLDLGNISRDINELRDRIANDSQ